MLNRTEQRFVTDDLGEEVVMRREWSDLELGGRDRPQQANGRKGKAARSQKSRLLNVIVKTKRTAMKKGKNESENRRKSTG